MGRCILPTILFQEEKYFEKGAERRREERGREGIRGELNFYTGLTGPP
jgi:hypothetical protein